MHARMGTAVVVALVLGASAARAQQVNPTPPARANGCRAVVDTTTSAVRVNIGGGSREQTQVNNARSKSTEVSAGEVAVVDSSRVADVPAKNSERRAVRVNVGGGSVPITRTNTTEKGIASDSTRVAVAAVCPDTLRKP